MTGLKTTPLHAAHQSLGAKLVDFAGFSMPVAYGSIIEEHMAVRDRVGLFDVSHMGEFLVTGARARDFVNEIITNDCSKLAPGRLQYTVMCRDDGTVVDDLLVFVLAEDRILLIVNASNIDKDFAHVTSFGDGGVDVKNVSDEYALIAVQGPLTREVLHNCAVFGEVAKEIDETPYYRGFWFDHRGQRVTVSRTGYTGELGFEILVPNALAEGLWNDLMEAGAQQGIKPVGLGARDTLRFEASLCLYGHELDDATTPLEAGLGWLVKLKKDKFRGLDALRREKAEGSRRKLVGFELEGRNIARQGYEVMHGGKPVGKVTSGAFAPALQKSLCMALVASEVGDNEDCSVEVRNKSVPAAATALPFYPSRAR